jgi:hypothetical protein
MWHHKQRLEQMVSAITSKDLQQQPFQVAKAEVPRPTMIWKM